MENNYLTAFIFSTIAGLSTVIGGFVTFFIKGNSLKFLSFGLGLSAGVMLFVSLVDLYPHAGEMIEAQMGHSLSWLAIACFGLGILTASCMIIFTDFW